MTAPDDDRLSAIEKRLDLLECERSIREVIERYGCAVDAGRGDVAAATFVPDGVYDSDFGRLSTTSQIASFIDGPGRADRHHRTAHVVGPLIVRIDTNRSSAVVVGYSMVLSRSEQGPSIDRVGINRWNMVRHEHAWYCASRVLRPVAHPEAASLLEPAITESELRPHLTLIGDTGAARLVSDSGISPRRFMRSARATIARGARSSTSSASRAPRSQAPIAGTRRLGEFATALLRRTAGTFRRHRWTKAARITRPIVAQRRTGLPVSATATPP